MDSVNSVNYIVIRHSLLHTNENYKFSFACFEGMTEKQIREIPEMTIVSKEKEHVGLLRFYRDQTYYDYFLGPDESVTIKREAGKYGSRYITNNMKNCYWIPAEIRGDYDKEEFELEKLELIRQTRETLLYCGIKPAKQ